jgi:hypothetical protein
MYLDAGVDVCTGVAQFNQSVGGDLDDDFDDPSNPAVVDVVPDLVVVGGSVSLHN